MKQYFLENTQLFHPYSLLLQNVTKMSFFELNFFLIFTRERSSKGLLFTLLFFLLLLLLLLFLLLLG
jgi:hypothetical protein